MNVINEYDALQENMKYYCETCDFLKDSIDTYMIMRRQKDREILPDQSVNTLIKYISRCRYNLGEMNEDYLIFEKNYLDKVYSSNNKCTNNKFKLEKTGRCTCFPHEEIQKQEKHHKFDSSRSRNEKRK